MAKKFGKLMVISAFAGAVAAGTYYLLQKKEEPFRDVDADDFDDFDDDLDDDTEDTLSEAHTAKSHGTSGRSYVSLDLEGAKEVIGEKVIETIDKTKERLENFNVSEKLDKAKEFVEEKIAQQTQAAPSAEPAVNVEPAASEEPVVNEEPAADEEPAAQEQTGSEEFFDDSELDDADSDEF